MKSGWIVYNAYCHLSSTERCIDRLLFALKKEGFDVCTKKHTELYLGYGRDGSVQSFVQQKKPDFCIYWDKDAQLAYMLQRWGVRVFNTPYVLEICDHKGKTFQELCNNGIKMPKTILSPLVYPNYTETDNNFADYVVKTLGLPLVVKKSYGSFGAQVYLAEDFDSFVKLRKENLHEHHLYQEYIKESKGKDLRVIAVGGKAICAMMRSNDKDFRANIELGGKGNPFALTEEICTLTTKLYNLLGADYFGVDFLFGKEGLLLCEINTNAHFLGIEEVTGEDIAGAYAHHIKKELN